MGYQTEYNKLKPEVVTGMLYHQNANVDIAPNYTGIARRRENRSSFVSNNIFLGGMKDFREIGSENGASTQKRSQHNIQIVSKEYDNSFELHISSMKLDLVSEVALDVAEFIGKANRIGYHLVDDLMLLGETQPCHDGQAFYSTSHPVRTGVTASNDIQVDISALPVTVHGASADAPSREEIQQAVIKGIEQLMLIPTDTGDQANEGLTSVTVMLPVGLWGVMFSGIAMPNNAGTTVQLATDMGRFKINYVVNFRLNSWSTKFTVNRTDSASTPFIIQPTIDPVFVYAAQANAQNGWNDRWDCYVALGAQYARWESSVLVELI